MYYACFTLLTQEVAPSISFHLHCFSNGFIIHQLLRRKKKKSLYIVELFKDQLLLLFSC